jgi:hypothetical protein
MIARQVRIDNGGIISIPPAGDEMDWAEVCEEMAKATDFEPLLGWGDWQFLVHAIDFDGYMHHFFVKNIEA